MNLPFFKKKIEITKQELKKEPILEVEDLIAPSSIVIHPGHLELEKRIAKSFFIFSYPQYLHIGWFAPIINLNTPMNISFFIHPANTETTLKQLRRKVTEIQAELAEREEKGLIREPSLEAAYHNLETLRDRLTTAQERMFKLGVYLTIYGNDLKEIKEVENTLRSILESQLIYIKPALYQQREGFNSSLPYGLDQLLIHTPMNTEPLSSTFPFISSDLSSNEGILYGINRHNNSLVLFDRFSLENANSVIFAKAGAGKSYAVKLEILRSLMFGTDIIVIDPDNEYRALSEAVDGSFFNVSLATQNNINPFDLPIPRKDEKLEDVLRSNIINLVALLRLMLGGLTSEEDAIIDRALTETYAAKDITPDTDPNTWQEKIPLMEDLEQVLEGMEGAESLVRRIRKFTKGTFAQFFNQPTSISMDTHLAVFGIRDIEDELRPIAIFIVMRYIWNKVRSELKKRILVVDEAWWLMKSEDSASFLFSLCKRSRKYWLGVTTITQDVNDFMKSEYGKPIITNSSLQFLMKQSSANIDLIQKTFNLTDEEKYILLEAEIGEGIFFAGQKHVLIKTVASSTEDQFITTSPEKIAQRIKQELQ
jgi:type IV secretory pathway VirB4 component